MAESTTSTADLLFELGTEELPPTALKRLSDAFVREFLDGLQKANLTYAGYKSYATPRRLAIFVSECSLMQPDSETERRGPALQAAFDKDGNPSKAANGFARSCGVSVDQLDSMKTDKGEWLMYKVHEKGKSASEILPAIAEQALARLPIPKRMRWGASDAQFVRPVHWVLFLHGDQVVETTLLDAQSDRFTHGHRFHHPEAIEISKPADYADTLLSQGRVIADFSARQDKIRALVESTAASLGGIAEIDEGLLAEVTALVEWPVPIAAGFEEKFLKVPHEALILTMKKNQKYFHLLDANGKLMNHFITIANIDSTTPEVIKAGNERVVRPRLADAMFFWQQDGKRRLEDHVESLKSVVFQQKLGSMYDKSLRVSQLAGGIAQTINADAELAKRAGMLSRCDLMTEMVYEFPEMQGIMGRYQATRDSEEEELANAMDEFYMPRFSGDLLPKSNTGIAVALADRIDTLVGIFGIGQRPTGDKDPFALRRAALGALRIMLEHNLPIKFGALLEQAKQGLGALVENANVCDEVYDFMLERLKGIYLERGIPVNVFDAVASLRPSTIADIERRITAVIAFSKLDQADALAAANKRIHNILKKSEQPIADSVDTSLFEGVAEQDLYTRIIEKQAAMVPLLASYEYEKILLSLAELRDTVDHFFDDVMVMVEDPAVRNNRLSLLKQLYGLFVEVADISRLPA